MSFYPRTLFGKISGLYLLLAVMLCVLCAWITAEHFAGFVRELEQKFNMSLAETLASEMTAALSTSSDGNAADSAMAEIVRHNPALEIYLLDAHGAILGSSVAEEKVLYSSLPLDPIRSFLSGTTSLPIRGPDPSSATARKVFSAAPIQIGESSGYLYVILRGMPIDSAAGMIRNSYILRALVFNLGIALVFTAVVGVVLFRVLTRRFRRLTDAVERFKNGEFDERLRDGDDEIGRLGATFNDMAATIEAQLEALRRTDDMRRRLVANVSHDFRTPLTSIRGYVQRMLSRGDAVNASNRQEYLRAVLKNTDRLGRLADQLSTLSRLDEVGQHPTMEPFSLAELAQDVAVKFEPGAEKKGIRLQAKYSSELPKVNADISLIDRVLSNLIDNALRSTPPGGSVLLELYEDGGDVIVKLTDTGCGIPADELALVTHRFYQTKRSRDRASGRSGLGLAIAKEVVEMHRRRLHIRSQIDKGTTITFRLPKNDAEAGSDARHADSSEGALTVES